ncbi:hypothetical protein KKH59_02510, partial [Patescibacteria group bacterium]|nr:hypothetical protein [Patescibacteria group bacterium]
YLALAVPLISIITLIPGFTIKNIILHPWKIITGPGLYIFAIYFFGTMGWAFYNLIKKYFISQGIERMQMKYLFLGATLSSLFGSFCNLILPLQGDYRFVWLGPVFTIFLIGFTALAILKYHLFEIRVILTELLVGVMGIILLVLPFLMPSLTLKALTIAIFLLFCIFGYYLIRATHEESKRREEAEVLAARERILKEEAERLAKERGKLAEQ